MHALDTQKMDHMVQAIKAASSACYNMWQDDQQNGDKSFRAQATFQISYAVSALAAYADQIAHAQYTEEADPTIVLKKLRDTVDLLQYAWSETPERLARHMYDAGLPFAMYAFTAAFKAGKLQLIAKTQDATSYVFYGSYDDMTSLMETVNFHKLTSVKVLEWHGPDIGYTISYKDGQFFTTALRTLTDPNTGEVIVREGQVISTAEFYNDNIVTALENTNPDWAEFMTLPLD